MNSKLSYEKNCKVAEKIMEIIKEEDVTLRDMKAIFNAVESYMDTKAYAVYQDLKMSEINNVKIDDINEQKYLDKLGRPLEEFINYINHEQNS